MKTVIIFGILTFVNLCSSFESSGVKCDAYQLVQYRLTFIGDWSEEKFPKQYPKFRPHAQWSKMIGRTHNSDYNLWSLGKVASSAFKKFAQEAGSDELDKRETQGFNGIFDTFIAPAINASIGESSVDIFVKNSHSMVSTAIRLIPSPDWFVGVNGIQLCVNGSWIFEAMVPLDPIDAGTDRGYTFTSPKWASRPRQPMHQITSTFPNHRANSFYYPELDALPRIAYMKFELLTTNKLHKQHRLVGHTRKIDDDSDEIDPEKKREELEEQQILNGEPILPGHGGGNDERPGRAPLAMPTLRRVPSAVAVRLRQTPPPAPPPRRPIPQFEDDEAEEVEDDVEIIAPPTTTPRPAPKRHHSSARNSGARVRDARPIDNRLANDHNRSPVKEKVGHMKQGLQQQQQPSKVHHRHHRREKEEERQDCQVGDWAHWSPCSKTCGFGAQKRVRKVTQPPKNGRPCPALQQEKWCGSMRACRDEQKLFSWLQDENGNSRGQVRS